jgi:fructosamine-3-kinase
MFDKRDIERALADAGITTQVERLRSVAGGSINQAAVVETASGEFFVKGNRRPIPDQFEREAEGLAALAAADTDLVIPKPLAWRATFLVLEFVPSGATAADYDEQMGRGLAALHATQSFGGDEPRFGFAHDNYCGATPQPNPWEHEWLPFYRDHRLRHMVELAETDRGWSGADRATFDRLFDRLEDLLVEGPPALIHGDLWSGNAHVGPNGEASIIDPATYFGHREAELGMMSLFGGFGTRVWDAYDEAMPLQAGWRERLPLYELYHVLNHYVLFGGGYGAQAVGIAGRFG